MNAVLGRTERAAENVKLDVVSTSRDSVHPVAVKAYESALCVGQSRFQLFTFVFYIMKGLRCRLLFTKMSFNVYNMFKLLLLNVLLCLCLLITRYNLYYVELSKHVIRQLVTKLSVDVPNKIELIID